MQVESQYTITMAPRGTDRTHAPSVLRSLGQVRFHVRSELWRDDSDGFILQTDAGQIAHKLLSGEIAIFPIIYPHAVNKISSGIRRNIIGWFSPNVTYEQSFILKNLYEVNASLMTTDKDMFVKSTLVQTYLKKLWGK